MTGTKLGGNHKVIIPMVFDIDRERHNVILNTIGKMIEKNQLRINRDEKQFSFYQISEAHQYVESGKSLGKYLLFIHFPIILKGHARTGNFTATVTKIFYKLNNVMIELLAVYNTNIPARITNGLPRHSFSFTLLI